MDKILQVRHLKKIFPRQEGGEIVAVDDVSFTLSAGEKLAIIGESGSGKTTVARMIARLIPPTAGRIFLAGEEITQARGKQLKKAYAQMQMVFQNPVDSFDPRCTLGDGISESLINHGRSREQAKKITGNLLALCGLPTEFAARFPPEVSGGQCQRAAIARALAIEPQLVILDEATSSIDTRTEKLIQEGMDKLMSGRTTFVIAHRLSTVKNSDCILVLEHGRVIERGTHDELLEQKGKYYQLYTGMTA